MICLFFFVAAAHARCSCVCVLSFISFFGPLARVGYSLFYCALARAVAVCLPFFLRVLCVCVCVCVRARVRVSARARVFACVVCCIRVCVLVF